MLRFDRRFTTLLAESLASLGTYHTRTRVPCFQAVLLSSTALLHNLIIKHCAILKTVSHSLNLLNNVIIIGVYLGHMKNAIFGVLTIAMYTTPKSAFFIDSLVLYTLQ